ncbi:hypothetical protein QQF64_027381 [Cirrhinus molitorella]|uniref:Uncharacterized protein n=1 Tax=Cirrhinus molitorella TaxID=172907 RepID=A0ABR3NCI8_9TELE
MWESHLRSSLMSGLKPEITAIIKQTCIGWEDEKLEKIRQHALLAKRLLEEKARGQGRGRGRGHRLSLIDPDICYYRFEKGHWRSQCSKLIGHEAFGPTKEKAKAD